MHLAGKGLAGMMLDTIQDIYNLACAEPCGRRCIPHMKLAHRRAAQTTLPLSKRSCHCGKSRLNWQAITVLPTI